MQIKKKNIYGNTPNDGFNLISSFHESLVGRSGDLNKGRLLAVLLPMFY